MEFCIQDPIGASFALANFEQGRKGQSPKGCKAKRAKGRNFVNKFLTIAEALYNVYTSLCAPKIMIVEDPA